MALSLQSIEDGYNVYEDQNGYETLIATTPPFAREVVYWQDFDLSDAWSHATHLHRLAERWGSPNRDAFLQDIRLGVADPESIDVVWCESCEEPTDADTAESVNNGTAHACESCYEENYRGCDDCGTTVHYEDTYYTLGGSSVCTPCLDGNYSHCDECEGYYHDSENEDHRHGGCDCESPEQVFAMRNDGEAVLNQDERVTIALPSGMISSEGIESIRALIINHSYTIPVPQYPYNGDPDEITAYNAVYQEREKWWNLGRDLESALGFEWQTREGNYTKRLSKLAYKTHGLKVPPAMLSQVGCIARDNSTGVDFAIELTRNLNLPAEDFYHEDSCWWQSYSESRCALKSNGGIGMRTFGGPYGGVQGRAWIMPLRLDEEGGLQPTFDSMTPDAFMIFNGYGDLGGYAPARIVAHMAGMTYRKVMFDASPMYINNSSGYLVTSEEIAAKYPAGSRIDLCIDTHSNLHRTETRSLTNA